MRCRAERDTTWFHACAGGDLHAIKRLRRSFARRFDTRETNTSKGIIGGFSGIHYAAYYGCRQAIELLFEDEADLMSQKDVLIAPDQNTSRSRRKSIRKQCTSQTTSVLRARSSALVTAIVRGHVGLARLLLELSHRVLVDPDTPPLMLERANRLLKTHDSSGVSALMRVCTAPQEATVQLVGVWGSLLLQKEISAVSASGKTCLHYAIEARNYAALEVIYSSIYAFKDNTEEGAQLKYKFARIILRDPMRAATSATSARGSQYIDRQDSPYIVDELSLEPLQDMREAQEYYSGRQQPRTFLELGTSGVFTSPGSNATGTNILGFIKSQATSIDDKCMEDIYSLTYAYVQRTLAWGRDYYPRLCRIHNDLITDKTLLRLIDRWQGFESQVPPPAKCFPEISSITDDPLVLKPTSTLVSIFSSSAVESPKRLSNVVHFDASLATSPSEVCGTETASLGEDTSEEQKVSRRPSVQNLGLHASPSTERLQYSGSESLFDGNQTAINMTIGTQLSTLTDASVPSPDRDQVAPCVGNTPLYSTPPTASRVSIPTTQTVTPLKSLSLVIEEPEQRPLESEPSTPLTARHISLYSPSGQSLETIFSDGPPSVERLSVVNLRSAPDSIGLSRTPELPVTPSHL
ncbi:Ankyrin repeat protein 1 [Giardia muris]|uniref:Ankyrin repeat protein 1 n=1 Tax=Giardia muris TaxID=5742 RepID=A0A4Z1SVR5_GIAMU|nr:Ankyrin repeat protein 1 [Giardia muris]|eukprot:TNJ28995.1 Ankyrin repeat protein 1 [Giardia muris]